MLRLSPAREGRVQGPRGGWGRLGQLRLGVSGEGCRVAGPPLASLPPRLAVFWARPNESVPPDSFAFPTRRPGPRRLPGTPRTLTIRPHGEARQTQQEQHRRAEPGAGPGSLGSHGPGVDRLAGSSEGSGCDRGCLGHCPACAARLCALRSARGLQASRPARREGGARTAPEAGDAGAAALGARTPGGLVRGAGEAAITRLRLRAGHLEASVPKEAEPDSELPGLGRDRG